ncbi:SGNH/GDSL hydrolase family protein [Paenibacillus solisilvae]|uniref:SGNH/GDSL hydrolase family protein n=1 Tax=Paenibacillus solisilvae TaxID=2486751 RepID=A0ABW0W4G0_9BACL
MNETKSGNHFIRLRRGLPRVNAKLAGNEPLAVAFLGGSITEGAGASDSEKTSWRALTGRFFKERFLTGEVISINAGVGGTTSTFGAHRLQEHVFAHGQIDLLFVEFSVNDGRDREESIKGMEGIVRQCRRLSPQTDICFVYTAADKNLTGELPFNIAVHEEVAVHYDIPSVSFAAPIYEQIQCGQLLWKELANDGVHPNDIGHALYALFLQEFLVIALLPGVREDDGQNTLTLPPPLHNQNYEYASMTDFRLADHPAEFYVNKLEDEPLMNWRFNTEHLFTDVHHASLSFSADGQSAGLLLLCGPGTGIFEYSFDGSTFHQVNLFDEWCLIAYRPVIAMFPLPAERTNTRIIIRNTGLKDERSKGTELRILKLL